VSRTKFEENFGQRPGGVMLSVHIADPLNEERMIETLRAEGAADVEQADGEWRAGSWADFDPVAAPRLVDLNQASLSANS